MKLDLNKYSINRAFIQEQYRKNKNGPNDLGKIVSICATSTHCPAAALAHYLAEDIGYTPELISIIDRLTLFYRYEEILGQKPGSPYLTKSEDSDINK